MREDHGLEVRRNLLETRILSLSLAEWSSIDPGRRYFRMTFRDYYKVPKGYIYIGLAAVAVLFSEGFTQYLWLLLCGLVIAFEFLATEYLSHYGDLDGEVKRFPVPIDDLVDRLLAGFDQRGVAHTKTRHPLWGEWLYDIEIASSEAEGLVLVVGETGGGTFVHIGQATRRNRPVVGRMHVLVDEIVRGSAMPFDMSR